MATTIDTYKVFSLDDGFAAGDRPAGAERSYVRLRRELDIGSFGVYAVRADDGKELMAERTAAGPGADRHEELYFVVEGHATFTVDGQELDAPAGTAIFVGDVEARRAAAAKADRTTIVVVGGRRGEAWRPTPGEAMTEFWPLYEAKDYEGALAVVRQGLEEYPGNALAHYNIACMSSLLDRPDEAVEHLRAALDSYPQFVENAREDDDFASLREDARFQQLVA